MSSSVPAFVGAAGKALLLLQALALAASGQTSDTSNEFWPEFDFYIRLNEKSRVYILSSATKMEDLGAYADGQFGAHIDYWALPALRKRIIQQNLDQSRSKMLMVRLGYIYSHPKNNSGAAIENMATGEVTGRAHLPAGWLFSHRSRVDFRWLNGDPAHRYRGRVKLERTFNAGRFQLTPYAYSELFYDFEKRNWTRLRYAAGAEWTVTKHIVLEGYYLRQNTWGSVPQFVNALGTAVQFYFR
jgi:hypothetical protein